MRVYCEGLDECFTGPGKKSFMPTLAFKQKYKVTVKNVHGWSSQIVSHSYFKKTQQQFLYRIQKIKDH